MSHGPETVIPQRYWAWGVCILAAAACLALTPLSSYWLWPAGFLGFLALVLKLVSAICIQTRSTAP